MTRSRNLRVYRACQRCRQRKLKCDPPQEHQSSCFECFRTGDECKPAGSRRGGNYSHLRRTKHPRRPTSIMATSPPNTESTGSWHSVGDRKSTGMDGGHAQEPTYAELKNPCDALQILANIATTDAHSPVIEAISPNGFSSNICADGIDLTGYMGLNRESATMHPTPSSLLPLSEAERLVNDRLGASTALQLLHFYAENYHTFCPLAPKSILETSDINQAAIQEPFLLTSILTIASKDDPRFRDMHQLCWQSMKQHMLDIVLAVPSTLNVGSVEGLILLSEWVPYQLPPASWNSRQYHKSLSSVEDNMAWSFIGQAVRNAYLLRLDNTSFRESNPGGSRVLNDRERLAWIFVYIADRQVSVRMGQSFWSRGPSLSTRFTADDFPTLQLNDDAQHNYASVLQATIELTQILHNGHDILYSCKSRTWQMMFRGDYNRYLDDFRRALSTWHDTWWDLKASPRLYHTLRTFFGYVRLYVNAFSFQSVLSRASADNQSRAIRLSQSNTNGVPSPFSRGIMASADGTYILEAVRAAKDILIIATEADPAAHIRYMPFRFYVYTIYSAVFLHKADVFDALSAVEHGEIRDLVRRFLHVLDDAVTSDCHVAHRYGKLLQKLWFDDAGGTDTIPDISRGDQVNPELSSYKESSFSPIPVDTDDATASGLGLSISEANYRLVPEFDLLYQSVFNLETDPFSSESATGTDFRI